MTLNDSAEFAGTERKSYERSEKKLRESLLSPDPVARAQWEKMLEIRALLKEYSTLNL